jgi:hypothetical protein
MISKMNIYGQAMSYPSALDIEVHNPSIVIECGGLADLRKSCSIPVRQKMPARGLDLKWTLENMVFGTLSLAWRWIRFFEQDLGVSPKLEGISLCLFLSEVELWSATCLS